MKSKIDFNQVRGVNYSIKPIENSDVIRSELAPMADLSTRKINMWRNVENLDFLANKKFAFDLVLKQKETAQLV